jgi:hypothetical protein
VDFSRHTEETGPRITNRKYQQNITVVANFVEEIEGMI